MSVITRAETITTSMRPRFEGANIRTWIGFKHLMYLVEESLLAWLREHELGPQRLYHEYGLSLAVTDCSVLLSSLIEIDDEVVAEVSRLASDRFGIVVRRDDDGRARTVLTSRARIALVGEPHVADRLPAPSLVADAVVPAAAALPADRQDLDLGPGASPESALLLGVPGAIYWPWRARYFHCHYSGRVQHSAYVRALEEIVDRYLEARGLSIPRVLADRGWIPVVSRARVQLLREVRMDETVHTVFAVEHVLKSVAYGGRMECYVERGRTLEHVATARILHGYAASGGESAGALVSLDPPVVAALLFEKRP